MIYWFVCILLVLLLAWNVKRLRRQAFIFREEMVIGGFHPSYNKVYGTIPLTSNVVQHVVLHLSPSELQRIKLVSNITSQLPLAVCCYVNTSNSVTVQLFKGEGLVYSEDIKGEKGETLKQQLKEERPMIHDKPKPSPEEGSNDD